MSQRTILLLWSRVPRWRPTHETPPRPFDHPTPFTEAIHSGVALITAHDVAAATGACDGAVTAARRDHNEERTRYTTTSARATHLAVAYNDRAEPHDVQDELALAAKDSARSRCREQPGDRGNRRGGRAGEAEEDGRRLRRGWVQSPAESASPSPRRAKPRLPPTRNSRKRIASALW